MNVPDDRIKTISVFQTGFDSEYLEHWILQEIARGIVLKLKEFHKVKVVKKADGYFHAECTLQIIVPPRVNEQSNRTINANR